MFLALKWWKAEPGLNYTIGSWEQKEPNLQSSIRSLTAFYRQRSSRWKSLLTLLPHHRRRRFSFILKAAAPSTSDLASDSRFWQLHCCNCLKCKVHFIYLFIFFPGEGLRNLVSQGIKSWGTGCLPWCSLNTAAYVSGNQLSAYSHAGFNITSLILFFDFKSVMLHFFFHIPIQLFFPS